MYKELQELLGVEKLHIRSKKDAVNIKQKDKGFLSSGVYKEVLNVGWWIEEIENGESFPLI